MSFRTANILGKPTADRKFGGLKFSGFTLVREPDNIFFVL